MKWYNMRTMQLGTLVLGLLFAIAAGCGGSDLKPVAVLQAADTPVRTATATPAPVPTRQPAPTTSPTPADSAPASGVPTAQQVVDGALAALGSAESFHFEVEGLAKIPIAGIKLDLSIAVVGDFQPPDRSRSVQMASLGHTRFETEIISIGGSTYATDLFTGEWDIVSGESLIFASPLGVIEDFRPISGTLVLEGSESLAGVEVRRISGTGRLPQDDFNGDLGEARVEMWVGVDDSRLYQMKIEAVVPAQVIDERIPAAAGASASIAITMKLSDFGLPVQIDPPDLGSMRSPGRTGGARLPDLGADHVLPGASHPDYNSVPATSGWHFTVPFAPAPWGIYDQVLPDEVLVHNLEHAGIGIHYDCPEGCTDLVDLLAQVAAQYPKVVLSPYPGTDSRISLTAWTFIDQMDDFDEGRIVAFIEEHMNAATAPEPLAP